MTRSAPDRGQQELVVSGPRAGGVPDRLYILTNRGNLAHWLSSGVIGPLEQFAGEKYWQDLQSLVPGRLVVLAGPLGAAVDAVPAESQGQFPVALEVSSSVFAPLDGVGAGSPAEQVIWSTTAWVPTSCIERVIFRSNTELAEYRARDYANVPPLDSATADPELFAAPGPLSAGRLGSLLRAASQASGEPAVEAPVGPLCLADRCSGAVSMALAALSADPAYGRRLKWPGAVAYDVDALAAGVRTLLGKAAVPEPAVLGACLAAVAELRRSRGWDPQGVLDRVKKDVLAAVAGNTAERMQVQLGYMDLVVNMEERLDLADRRLADASLTALLTFLLHPAPEESLSWARSAGAAVPIQVLAAAFAGLAEGLTRLQREFKPRALTTVLVTWYLNALGLPGRRPVAPARLAARFVPSWDVGGRLEVTVGDEVVVSHERPSVTERLLAVDLSDPRLADTLLDLCAAMGWDDECVIHELEIDSAGPVQVRSLDRITFVGRLVDALEARLLGVGGRLVVRYRGGARTRSSVDEQALRTRLETDGLSAEVAKAIRARLG